MPLIVGNVMVCSVTFQPVIGGTIDKPVLGPPDDPQQSVVFTLTKPDGTQVVETYPAPAPPAPAGSIVRDARGVYHRNVSLDQEGGWTAEFDAGPGYLEAAGRTRWAVYP